MAAALLDGEVTLKQFTDEKVTAPAAQDLMSKVKLVELKTEVKEGQMHSDPPQIVTLKLRDGNVYSHQVSFAKGEPENPMTAEELVHKFRDCAGGVLPAGNINRILELVLNLESLPEITELMQLLSNEDS
jgi:2-methylcitrate dehydratase